MSKYDFSDAVNPFEDAVDPFSNNDYANANNPFADANDPFDVPSYDRSWGEAAVDTGASIMAGFASMGGGLVHLADLAASGLGADIDIGARKLFEDAGKFYADAKSKGMQNMSAELEKAEGVGGTLNTLWEHPQLVGDLIATSIPYLLPTGAASRIGYASKLASGGSKAAAVARGANAAAITGGVIEGADAGSEAYNALMNMTPEQLLSHSSSYRDMMAQNIPHEEAIEKLAYRAGLTATAITTPLAILASKVTGASKLETEFFTGNLAKEWLGLFVREGIEEAIQEGSNKFGMNVAISEFADDRVGYVDGIPKAATLGATLGVSQAGGMKAIGSGYDAIRNRATPSQRSEQVRNEVAAQGGDLLDQIEADVNDKMNTPEPQMTWTDEGLQVDPETGEVMNPETIETAKPNSVTFDELGITNRYYNEADLTEDEREHLADISREIQAAGDPIIERGGQDAYYRTLNNELELYRKNKAQQRESSDVPPAQRGFINATAPELMTENPDSVTFEELNRDVPTGQYELTPDEVAQQEEIQNQFDNPVPGAQAEVINGVTKYRDEEGKFTAAPNKAEEFDVRGDSPETVERTKKLNELKKKASALNEQAQDEYAAGNEELAQQFWDERDNVREEIKAIDKAWNDEILAKTQDGDKKNSLSQKKAERAAEKANELDVVNQWVSDKLGSDASEAFRIASGNLPGQEDLIPYYQKAGMTDLDVVDAYRLFQERMSKKGNLKPKPEKVAEKAVDEVLKKRGINPFTIKAEAAKNEQALKQARKKAQEAGNKDYDINDVPEFAKPIAGFFENAGANMRDFVAAAKEADAQDISDYDKHWKMMEHSFRIFENDPETRTGTKVADQIEKHRMNGYEPGAKDQGRRITLEESEARNEEAERAKGPRDFEEFVQDHFSGRKSIRTVTDAMLSKFLGLNKTMVESNRDDIVSALQKSFDESVFQGNRKPKGTPVTKTPLDRDTDATTKSRAYREFKEARQIEAAIDKKMAELGYKDLGDNYQEFVETEAMANKAAEVYAESQKNINEGTAELGRMEAKKLADEGLTQPKKGDDKIPLNSLKNAYNHFYAIRKKQHPGYDPNGDVIYNSETALHEAARENPEQFKKINDQLQKMDDKEIYNYLGPDIPAGRLRSTFQRALDLTNLRAEDSGKKNLSQKKEAQQELSKESPIPLLKGDKFSTVSGRETTPFPKTNYKREALNQQKMREWLKENAIAEAKARGDDFNLVQWNALDVKNWSQADGDAVNLYLFDDVDGRIGNRKVPKDGGEKTIKKKLGQVKEEAKKETHATQEPAKTNPRYLAKEHRDNGTSRWAVVDSWANPSQVGARYWIQRDLSKSDATRIAKEKSKQWEESPEGMSFEKKQQKQTKKEPAKTGQLDFGEGKPLSEINLKRTVEVEETGEVVDIEINAETELRRLDKRGNVLQSLMDCVRG
jgi:hypothetical protein